MGAGGAESPRAPVTLTTGLSVRLSTWNSRSMRGDLIFDDCTSNACACVCADVYRQRVVMAQSDQVLRRGGPDAVGAREIRRPVAGARAEDAQRRRAADAVSRSRSDVRRTEVCRRTPATQQRTGRCHRCSVSCSLRLYTPPFSASISSTSVGGLM